MQAKEKQIDYTTEKTRMHKGRFLSDGSYFIVVRLKYKDRKYTNAKRVINMTPEQEADVAKRLRAGIRDKFKI